MFAVSELSYWEAGAVGVVEVSSCAPAATDNVAGKALPSTATSVAAIFLAPILSPLLLSNALTEPTGFRGPAHDANGLFFSPELPGIPLLSISVNRGNPRSSG